MQFGSAADFGMAVRPWLGWDENKLHKVVMRRFEFDTRLGTGTRHRSRERHDEIFDKNSYSIDDAKSAVQQQHF